MPSLSEREGEEVKEERGAVGKGEREREREGEREVFGVDLASVNARGLNGEWERGWGLGSG